ncbi:MAG: dienelactone hydrolase family protein [Vicinamibacterales bacterium]
MTEATVDLKTADGVMTTRTFQPGDAESYPAVVFYMDGLGVRDALVDMARRLASNGYYVVLPNLFYRSGSYAPFDGASVFSDPAERERIMGLIKEVTPARVTSDTAVLLDWLKTDAGVGISKIGTVGYCMGGGHAISAAGAFPDRVAAAASYHGGRLATDAPDSPHVVASRARGRIYIGHAENDNSFPDAQRQRLEAAFTQAHVSYSIELYHAAHGFAIPDLPVYDANAADRHWETMLALFRESLG